MGPLISASSSLGSSFFPGVAVEWGRAGSSENKHGSIFWRQKGSLCSHIALSVIDEDVFSMLHVKLKGYILKMFRITSSEERPFKMWYSHVVIWHKIKASLPKAAWCLSCIFPLKLKWLFAFFWDADRSGFGDPLFKSGRNVHRCFAPRVFLTFLLPLSVAPFLFCLDSVLSVLYVMT